MVQAAVAQIQTEKAANDQLKIQAAQLNAELQLARQQNQVAAHSARAEANYDSRQAAAAAFKEGMAYAKEMLKDLKDIMQ